MTAFKPLTKEDIADLLGVSLRTIENWVNDGILPSPKKLGSRVYWHPTVFYAWLDQRLTADSDDTEEGQNTFSAPSSKLVRPQRPSKAVSSKTELETMRRRTQVQLAALVG